MLFDRARERGDIDGVLRISRHGAQRRLHAQRLQRVEDFVVGGRGGRAGILRIERKGDEPVAALGDERLHARGDRRRAVTHGPIDDGVLRGERLAHFLRLAPRDGAKRGFVELLVPDAAVFGAAGERSLHQHDEVQNQPPQHPVGLDHAPVGQELLEIAAHRPIGGAVGRAEIDEQDPDPALRSGRL